MDDGSGDTFLCEDDLVLSNINLKTFKEMIRKRVNLKFQFAVKKYVEQNKNKRKAINLEIVNPE